MKGKLQKVGIGLIKIYWCLSFASLCISDDSRIWVIVAVVANFAVASILLRFVPLTDGDDRA